MIVVADASPLIFLGKIAKLGLVSTLFPGELLVPGAVRDEVLGPRLPPAEERVLTTFLSQHTVVSVKRRRHFAAAMSLADNEALTLALRRRADFLLADERLLRALARVEGIHPVGTLGVLLRAKRAALITPQDVRRLVDTLIREHAFRIGIEVYQAVLSEIEA